MLNFRKVNIEDKEKCEKYLKTLNTHFCEHSFVDIFIWSEHYSTEIAFYEDNLFIKMKSYPEKVNMYLAPIGTGDLKTAIKKIHEHADSNNTPFIIVSVWEEMKKSIESILPDKFYYKELRDSADYVYLSEKMISLAGKKLHSKRNFINRFKKEYEGRWSFEDITSENISEVMSYQQKWCAVNRCQEDQSFIGESNAIKSAFDNFEELSLKGGILRVDGEIIAYTIGSKSTQDMFIIQIEKAEHTIAGAYQMINNEFAKKNCSDVKYINREEDLGLEGLRKAKLSYYPEIINIKYMAVSK